MGITVLSLFDGISCGQIALERAGIKVDRYYASEIKKCAIETTMRNYPGGNRRRQADDAQEKARSFKRVRIILKGIARVLRA